MKAQNGGKRGLAVLGVLAAMGLGAPGAVCTAQSVTPTTTATLEFAYLIAGDTVGGESLRIEANSVSGVLLMRGQPYISWTQKLVNGQPGSLTMDVGAPGGAPGSTPQQHLVITPDGDGVVLEVAAGGRTQRQVVPSKAGAMPLIGQSVLHAAVISRAMRLAGKSSAPLFLTSGGQTMDGSLSVSADTTSLSVAGLPVRVVWQGDQPLSAGVAPQQLKVVRVATPVRQPRLNYDAPAGAPYRAEQVSIPTARGYSLAATLTIPDGSMPEMAALASPDGRWPVAVTISGSGPQERDSGISIVPGYAPFREIADTLGRRGVAVLRYDDRGVGESGGADSRAAATSADFADDVQSVLSWLKPQSEVDSSRMLLIGHSEGGLIAPMVAVREPEVHAVVLLAGTAYNGRKILMYQNQQLIDSSKTSPAALDSINKQLPRTLDSLANTNAWLRYFMDTDPKPTIARVRQPVLILQGDSDHQVTPEQADTIAATLKRSGNTAVTLRHFPAVNHLFLNDPDGRPAGYPTLPDARLSRSVLGALADWVADTMRTVP